MLYTEFYVVPPSVDATASNLNGGSGGTPIVATAVMQNGGTFTASSGQFSGVNVGDFFTWTITGHKERGVVTSVTHGSPNDILTGVRTDVFPTTSFSDIFGTMYLKGNWADPSTVTGLTYNSINAAGKPPRLNIYEPATYSASMMVSTSFTAAIPLTIEGYAVTPGDLRYGSISHPFGTMIAPLIQLNSGIPTDALVQINGSYVAIRNLSVSTTQAKHGIELNGITNCQIINCTVQASGPYNIYLVGGSYHVINSCLLTLSGNTGVHINGGDAPVIINNRFVGSGSGSGCIGVNVFVSRATIAGNVFYNFTGDVIVWYYTMTLAVLNNTFNSITGNGVNAGAMTDLSTLTIEGCIFSGVTGKVVTTTSGTNVYLARYAHNLEYSIGARFSANVLDNSEDIVTGSNPFANGNEIPTGGALSHQELMADGVLYTYPDLGAMQTLSTNPGVGNVKGPPGAVTYYFGGVLYTGTGANIAGRGGFIFGD